MPRVPRLIFPDLLNYPTLHAFRRENPALRFSDSAYYKERERQRKDTIIKEKQRQLHERSIVQKELNEVRIKSVEGQAEQLQRMMEQAKTQEIPIKTLLPLPDALAMSQRAITSLRMHMVTQWQAAAWWLERVHPEIFGKRETAPATASIIGIRLEVHHKHGSVSKEIAQGMPLNSLINDKSV
jgi:hypothetical protein